MSKVVQQLKQLDLPAGHYMVIGSGILDALGIRQSNDIDLLVSPQLYQQLQERGWPEEVLVNGWRKLAPNPDIEVWLDWADRDLSQWLAEAAYIHGIAFVSLPALKAWKQQKGRAKDLDDIQLINRYLESY